MSNPSKTFTPETGTGGFPDNEGNLHHYDVGVTDEGPSTEKWSPGSVSTNVDGKDLSVKTKKTLSSYLSAATQKNYYPVSPAPPNQTEIKLIENELPVNPSVSKNESNFNTDEAKFPTLKSVSNYYVRADLPKVFIKGKGVSAEQNAQNGNSLLSSVQLVEGTNEIDVQKSPVVGKYSSAIINNRFSRGSFESRLGSDSLKERIFYDPNNLKMGEAPDQSLDENYQYSFGRLSQIGDILMSRASYELNSFAGGDVPNDDKALLPGLAQMGISRIEVSELEVQNVLSELTTDDIDPKKLINPSSVSWGNLNNQYDKFSGVSNLGMQLLTLAMTLALGLTFLIFTAGLGSPTKHIESENGILPMGRWKPGTGQPKELTANGLIKALFGGFSLFDILGLYNPTYPFGDCLLLGLLIFLGGNPNPADFTSGYWATLGTFFSTIGKLIVDGVQAPGHSMVMMRTIIRSIFGIVDAFAAVGNAWGSVTGVIKKLLEIFSVLRDSKLMRSMNVFVTLGDALLSVNPLKQVELSGEKRVSDIDSIADFDSAGPYSHTKSRLRGPGKENNMALAWSSYRAPDRIILHPSTINSILFGGLEIPRIFETEKENLRKAGQDSISQHTINSTGRLTTEERESFENYLESEYVPFYFHDVRTNEIVSFHAFLASLSDDYTANYDNADGFGRIESVKIYKNTSRKISFSFYVAALSESDFDSMWIKINKLTTMVYPQFTEGQYVEQGTTHKYVAPFSQQIAASPLTRVRIGDLIKSNYSRYNLAKIFGYGNEGTKFGTAEAGAFATKVADLAKIKTELEGLKTKTSEFFFAPSGELKITGFVAEAGLVPPILPSVDAAPLVLPTGLLLKVNSSQGETVTCEIVLPKDDEMAAFGLKNTDELNKQYGDAAPAPQKIIGKKIYVNKNAMTITEPSFRRFVKTQDGNASTYATSVAEFMNDVSNAPNGNIIAKSFRTVGGKGLAGFIESIGFDWMDKVTWSTDKMGRKAPKMCKINISFAPIHDITPGLDHRGVNRAPIYQVGPYAPSPRALGQ